MAACYTANGSPIVGERFGCTPATPLPARHRPAVYNLLDSQATVNVHTRYESTPGTQMPYFGQAKGWQSPRYMNLVVTYSF